MEGAREHGPPELVHLPEPTVMPILVAFGLLLALVGLITWWFYTLVGLILVLVGAGGWLRIAARRMRRLPRSSDPVVVRTRARH